jgi:hypothetical protein
MLSVLLERDMQACAWIAKFFGEPKIDDVDEMCSFTGAHDKIGRFEITVDEVS